MLNSELCGSATEMPGVKSTAAALKIPLRGNGDNFGLTVQGRPGAPTSSFFRIVTLDYFETLSSVAKLAIPIFADWAGVDVVGSEGKFERVTIAHKDPAKIAAARALAARYPPREDDAAQVALRTGKSLLIEVISDALVVERARDQEHLRLLRELGLKSVIIAPMVANEMTVVADVQAGR